MMLALDLGTKCGWARGGQAEGKPISGALNLAGNRFSGGGMRYVLFENELTALLEGVTRVGFEEVRRHLGVDAAHVYGGLMAVLMSQCEKRGIPYEGIPVGSWKRAFTGRGNASKSDVLGEAEKRGFKPRTEDEADALGVWHFMAAAP